MRFCKACVNGNSTWCRRSSMKKVSLMRTYTSRDGVYFIVTCLVVCVSCHCVFKFRVMLFCGVLGKVLPTDNLPHVDLSIKMDDQIANFGEICGQQSHYLLDRSKLSLQISTHQTSSWCWVETDSILWLKVFSVRDRTCALSKSYKLLGILSICLLSLTGLLDGDMNRKWKKVKNRLSPSPHTVVIRVGTPSWISDF